VSLLVTHRGKGGKRLTDYLYTYAFHEDEQDLCFLEMRSLFGTDSDSKQKYIHTPRCIHPNRSPFIKERVEILYEAPCLEELLLLIEGYHIMGTFKVVFIDCHLDEKMSFDNRRSIERTVGLRVRGAASLKNPTQLLAVVRTNHNWIFGTYLKSESIWLLHQQKPQNYSTALSTRVARAVVNIAVPIIDEVKVIDPCCGIGTVLIEALSLEINIVGSDINPLATTGARENLTHFGLKGNVVLQDIRDIRESYDVMIMDMPYNLCSVLPMEDKLEMLSSARRLAQKAVVVTVEPLSSYFRMVRTHTKFVTM